MKKNFLTYFLVIIIALTLTGCGKKNKLNSLGGDEPLRKDYSDIVFRISKRNSACIPTELVFYKDGTYELFTAYKACKPNQTCTDVLKYTKSIKGQYDYDIMKIVENSVNSADKSYMNENRPEYEIYMGNSYVEKGYGYYYTIENGQTNKYLEELLNEIDVNLKVCAEPEYID